MSHYGNILSLYDRREQHLEEVRTVLTTADCHFIELDGTYFIKSTSIKHTKRIIAALNALDLKFTFVHLYLKEGSYIISKGVDETNVTAIRGIINNQYHYED